MEGTHTMHCNQKRFLSWSICFVTEFASHKSYPAEIERNNEQPQPESKDVSSQDNSDEDDEEALREQLLKSLAVKRKAKLGVEVNRSSDCFNGYMHLKNIYFFISCTITVTQSLRVVKTLCDVHSGIMNYGICYVACTLLRKSTLFFFVEGCKVLKKWVRCQKSECPVNKHSS